MAAQEAGHIHARAAGEHAYRASARAKPRRRAATQEPRSRSAQPETAPAQRARMRSIKTKKQ